MITQEKIDVASIINEAMEKKDRYVSIFIGEAGTTISVYPHEDSKTTWKYLKEGSDPICSNCGRIVDQPFPFCPWCGEEIGLGNDIQEMLADASVRKNNPRKRIRKIWNEDKGEEKDEVNTESDTDRTDENN